MLNTRLLIPPPLRTKKADEARSGHKTSMRVCLMFTIKIVYVTNDSINKKAYFLKILNSSYKVGCLHLGMKDTH